MSSFNKEKEYKKYKSKETESENTSYYTFFAGILLIIVIRYFIVIYKKIFYKVKYNDESKYKNCHCSKCKERYQIYKLKIKSQNINKKLYFNIFLFFVFIYLFIGCCKKVQNSNLKGFDPYEILEVSELASISQIKKSYKALSLKYHPDKNPNNSKAKEKFMNINKAYRALTNEQAKENYKKYGNPDGPGALSYGFALPFFLFQGKLGSFIIILFGISMVIIFPIMFIRWFQNSKKYNDDGLLIENFPFYYNIMNKDILITSLPFVIGMSKEFNDMDIAYDEGEIEKLLQVFIPYFPKGAEYDNISYKNMMAIAILYVHYSDSTIIIEDKQSNEQFIRSQNKILEKSVFLIDQLIKTILEINRIYEFNKGLEEFSKTNDNNDNNNKYKNIKNFETKQFDFNLIKMIISFRSRLFHETNIKSKNDELLIFPNNKDNLSLFEKNNYTSIVKMMNDILKGKNNKFKHLKNFNDIEEVIEIMPKYTMKVELLDNFFPEAGNILTFNIKVTRGDVTKINTNEQKELGYLHSNNYSDNYNEKIVVFILDKDKQRLNYYEIMQFKYINEEKKIEYEMLAEKQGKNTFEIYLLSLSYPGIYISQNTSIKIKEENNYFTNFIKNRYRTILSEDEFQEKYGILNDNIENENDEEEEHEHKD